MLLVVGSCHQLPTESGFDMCIVPSRGPIEAHEKGWSETLQVHWLGSACYVLQLGDVTVLTDPFVSHQGFLRSLLGFELESDEGLVTRTLGRWPVVDAVFVGHSHWDHELDLGPLLRFWNAPPVPVYGSETAHNLLGGLEERFEPRLVRANESNWNAVPTNGKGTTVEYMAWTAEHAPHFLCIRLYDGSVDEPLEPTRAHHYRVGEYYVMLFRFSRGERSFTVLFADSAFDFDEEQPIPAVTPIDVAILCVPGWKWVDGYPGDLIRRLKPSNIVLSHHNNFFEDREDRGTMWTADLPGFLGECQRAATYEHFRSIVVPDMGATLRFTRDPEAPDA